jgi:hypothetical protein
MKVARNLCCQSLATMQALMVAMLCGHSSSANADPMLQLAGTPGLHCCTQSFPDNPAYTGLSLELPSHLSLYLSMAELNAQANVTDLDDRARFTDSFRQQQLTGRHFHLGVAHTFRLPDGSSFTPGLEFDAISRNKAHFALPMTVTGANTASISAAWRPQGTALEFKATRNNVLNDPLYLNLTDINRFGEFIVREGSARSIALGFNLKFD